MADIDTPAPYSDESGALPRSCESCFFSQRMQIRPTDLRRHLFCYRLPPVPVGMPSAGGLQVNCMHPPVQPAEWCYEFRPKMARMSFA